MQIYFFANLREIIGAKTIELSIENETTLRQVLIEIFQLYPGLEDELLDDHGQVRRHVNINHNGRNLSLNEEGLEIRLGANDRLMIFPSIGGGN